MQVEYTDVIFENGKEIHGKHKKVKLPFRRTSARAIIIRRKDLAILGTLHRHGGNYALPGGSIDNGESSEEAILRELDEENIILTGSDGAWRQRISVDYYTGYHELTIWYVFVVDDVTVGPCYENIETRWINQDEDVWYPYMREKILLSLMEVTPYFSKLKILIA